MKESITWLSRRPARCGKRGPSWRGTIIPARSCRGMVIFPSALIMHPACCVIETLEFAHPSPSLCRVFIKASATGSRTNEELRQKPDSLATIGGVTTPYLNSPANLYGRCGLGDWMIYSLQAMHRMSELWTRIMICLKSKGRGRPLRVHGHYLDHPMTTISGQ